MKFDSRCFGVGSILLFLLLRSSSCVKDCPRDESRVARTIINEVVLPIFTKFDASPPSGCLWAPHRDIYRRQEEHKMWVSENQWDCQFCGKAFYSEEYLDRHFKRKHDEHEYRGSDKVCVSDFCSVLRCDALRPGASIGYWQKALCKERDMFPILDMCKDIVHDCVPTGHKHADDIRSQLLKEVCDYLTCKMRWKEPPNWGRLWNVTYLIIALVCGLGLLFLLMLLCVSQANAEHQKNNAMASYTYQYSDPARERARRRSKYSTEMRYRKVY